MYSTLTVCDYWNCTDVPALWCSWLPELLAALFGGGGSLLPVGFMHEFPMLVAIPLLCVLFVSVKILPGIALRDQ